MGDDFETLNGYGEPRCESPCAVFDTTPLQTPCRGACWGQAVDAEVDVGLDFGELPQFTPLHAAMTMRDLRAQEQPATPTVVQPFVQSKEEKRRQKNCRTANASRKRKLEAEAMTAEAAVKLTGAPQFAMQYLIATQKTAARVDSEQGPRGKFTRVERVQVEQYLAQNTVCTLDQIIEWATLAAQHNNQSAQHSLAKLKVLRDGLEQAGIMQH